MWEAFLIILLTSTTIALTLFMVGCIVTEFLAMCDACDDGVQDMLDEKTEGLDQDGE